MLRFLPPEAAGELKVDAASDKNEPEAGPGGLFLTAVVDNRQLNRFSDES